MREDKTHRGVFRQAQFRHYWLEVVTAGTQAMKPNNGGGRVFSGFNLDVLKILHGLPLV